MSTLDAAKPSCSNAKGSNERPLNDDDCSTRAKPPKLKPQPSQSLPSPKPQPVAKHLTTDTADQHDAFSIAAWLSRADRDGSLGTFLNPQLTPSEREVATVEGWILGARGLIRSRRSSLRDE